MKKYVCGKCRTEVKKHCKECPKCGKKFKKQGNGPQKMKKSYNPFKMWGSWVGLVLGLIVPLPLSPMALVPPIFMIIGMIFVVLTIGFPANFTDPFLFIVIIFLPPILGFIIGWGIHSLIRKRKNEK